MSLQRATKTVYKSLIGADEYPVQSLNRFKQDPRVRIGPRFDSWDPWRLFNFMSELQRSRKRWFAFQARSRFYAIEARSAREAKRIVEQYRPVLVPQFLVVHDRREGDSGARETCSIRADRSDIQGAPGTDSVQSLVEARRRLLQVFKLATIQRRNVIPLFRN